MNNLIMKEFWNGLSVFVKMFWANAAKQGFSIMLLILTNIGFVLWINEISKDLQTDKMEHHAEIEGLRNEYRMEIARLRFVIDSCRQQMSDCAANVARLQGENWALVQIIKQKR